MFDSIIVMHCVVMFIQYVDMWIVLYIAVNTALEIK